MEYGYLLHLDRRDFVTLGNYQPSSQNTKTIHESLERVVGYELLDGTKIQNEWFPEMNADVFISHSGKDERYALQLSDMLQKQYNVKSFVDSLVWGYFPDLLKLLDNGKNEEKKEVNLAKYDKCSSHVHNMLSIALAKMIQKCGCFIFIDTDNSRDSFLNMTVSPWIYYELSISSLLIPKQNILTEGLELFTDIAYKAPTSHLTQIALCDIRKVIKDNQSLNEMTHCFDRLSKYKYGK